MKLLPPHLGIKAAVAQLADRRSPSLIGIDGLPCAGKSTIAEALERLLNAECVGLDEFVLPEREWPRNLKAAFPFEYIRYDAFLGAVEALATEGYCSFHPFDWSRLTISPNTRTVTRTKPIVIEGVSSLHPELCRFYDFRVFVESDRETTLQAAIDRGIGPWARAWREIFLPSADLYMLTEPQKRADLLIAGRGAPRLRP